MDLAEDGRKGAIVRSLLEETLRGSEKLEKRTLGRGSKAGNRKAEVTAAQGGSHHLAGN